jgi:hypothetical protein
MKKYLSALVLSAVLAQPAAAVTFPSLTTIYVGSGVYDNGGVANAGEATSIHCSNVSGVAVQVRVLVLGNTGSVEGSLTVNVGHGASATISTHATAIFAEGLNLLDTGSVSQGVVNVEATNSAVFCTADRVDAENVKPAYMSPLHLVRVNPHPGTVE